MAKITRIKAKDSSAPKDSKKEAASVKKPQSETSIKLQKPANSVAKPEQKSLKKAERAKKKAEKQAQKAGKKPFILFRPFIAFGRYVRDSWHELRQVRWPNRTTTWKMVLAVIIYSLIFLAFLVALDVLFDFIFSKLLA